MKPHTFTPGDPQPTGLCIVVPVLNEAQGIEATLKALGPLRQRGARVVVVDGGSQDDTPALARAHADAVIDSPRGRAAQMNAGAALGWGEVLLFLHADTTLPERADEHLMQAHSSRRVGSATSLPHYQRHQPNAGRSPRTA